MNLDFKVIDDKALDYAKKWYKDFLQINAEVFENSVYLEIDGFSIEVSSSEILERAKQYQDFLNDRL